MKNKSVETLIHSKASRRNIPTAEYQPIMTKENMSVARVAYSRRNQDLDPQLVWQGKDEQDVTDLVVDVPPIYIQEKVNPKVLINDLVRQKKKQKNETIPELPDLYSDFNGFPDGEAKTDFYRHDGNWSNRMIFGDSLQTMTSLAEREGLRSKVQCIYFDPPYGIKYNSNFQWSTTSREVKDGRAEHITREPEQVKAFRDTWKNGIHSYLTYLRDRLNVANNLLADSGSIFVQIGDENVHRVRVLLDEVFGDDNYIREIFFAKTGSMTSNFIGRTGDRIIWYAKNIELCKYRPLFETKKQDKFYKFVENHDFTCRELTKEELNLTPSEIKGKIFRLVSLESSGKANEETPFDYCGKTYYPSSNRHWQLSYPDGMNRLKRSGRIAIQGNKLRYRLYIDDYPLKRLGDVWTDTTGFATDQVYVVETRPKVIERCLLMASDPGDLVLDPTCGSGTTAYVAEQCGRRWITIDTSRVALTLARSRMMGARYPWYILSDSPEGRKTEAGILEQAYIERTTGNDICQGFVYKRVPHITLKAISDNIEIDQIWMKWQDILDLQLNKLNHLLNTNWKDWNVPRKTNEQWPKSVKITHKDWWQGCIQRQTEINASISANSAHEFLYDQPYTDNSRIRVAGPFTIESLTPHRTISEIDNDDYRFNDVDISREISFIDIILENLKVSGVQQAYKDDFIKFISLTPWAGSYVSAEGRYFDGGLNDQERRAGIFIGPEFGTVSRPDLVAATREASDAGFDVLVSCAFNYDAHSTDFKKLGKIPVLKARMNADLHMTDDLKNTGKGNLFVIFGEPDFEVISSENRTFQVQINGVDIYHPSTGDVRSHDTDGIACWFVDTDYNEESFFIRQAYFLGSNDPYKKLKITLKSEIDFEAWSTLNSNISRPFPKPMSGRIAVKVINHLGDEIMKVIRI